MLAFSNDYYGFIFRATQSVELFCAYLDDAQEVIQQVIYATGLEDMTMEQARAKLLDLCSK